MTVKLYCEDVLDFLGSLPDDSVDLIFSSPPYEAQRTYGLGGMMSGEQWVDWMVDVWVESERVCKGLVAYVVEGHTSGFTYSATPLLLGARLYERGFKLRKPPIFHRVGIFGSGGPDWWRNDYEYVLCTTRGRLPWSDNKACGNPPKYPPGGHPSHRRADGSRVDREYTPPDIANPGNVLWCPVGSGHMGNELAHENEAPFPESLVEPFVLSFCPPEGLCCDPFVGSGTVPAVCERFGRDCIANDVRESQIELTKRRLGL